MLPESCKGKRKGPFPTCVAEPCQQIILLLGGTATAEARVRPTGSFLADSRARGLRGGLNGVMFNSPSDSTAAVEMKTISPGWGYAVAMQP